MLDARGAGVSATAAGRLDRFVNDQIRQTDLAGVSVVLVKNEQVLLARGYGVANVATHLPMTANTPMLLASVSKTVTAVAAMQLVEAGKLDLDRDINLYLPFRVRNPQHPDVPITTRMLLTHTSSISDNDPFPEVAYSKGDSPIALGAILRDYLTPQGRYSTLATTCPVGQAARRNTRTSALPWLATWSN